MDQELFERSPPTPMRPSGTSDAEHGRPVRDEVLRCAICARRLGSTLAYLEETGDIPEPRQSWLLCGGCDEAVHQELERSPVRSPLRLRVAVGLVAAERTPAARRARFGQLSDMAWERLL